MVNDRGDLLGVTFKCCHDLLLILVKHHNILISSTWGTQDSGCKKNAFLKNLACQKIYQKINLKVKDAAQHWMKPMYQWELCWCLRDTDPEPEYQEHWRYGDPEGNNESACYHYVNLVSAFLNKRDKLEGQESSLTACEATWWYLLRSSALTSSSGTVFPLWRNSLLF